MKTAKHSILSGDEFAALSPDDQFEYCERTGTDPGCAKFRKGLESFRFSGARNAIDCARSNGLSLGDLYTLSIRYEPSFHIKELEEYRGNRKDVLRFVKSLRESANGLRAMALLQFPYKPSADSDLYTAADPSDLLCDPFETFSTEGVKEAAVRVKPWLGNMAPFIAAEALVADWKSPYCVPAYLVESLSGYPSDTKLAKWGRRRLKGRRSWLLRVQPGPSDFQAIATILDDFAEQTEVIAAQLRRPRGRASAFPERAFRKEFAAYARQKSGKYLDALGAAVFSLTFRSMNAKDYARERQRDVRAARKGVRKNGTAKKRRTR